MATPEELAEENARMRKVRHLVDFSTALIAQSQMTRPEAVELIAFVRRQILEWFPEGEQAYELIYAPRFRRVLHESRPAEPPGGPGILPFRHG